VKWHFAKGKKTEHITVETDQVIVIRRSRVCRSWCDVCQDNAEFIPVEEINRAIADGLIRKSSAAIAGLHFSKAPDGSTVVCGNSLVRKQ